jgi:hypothetical protein
MYCPMSLENYPRASAMSPSRSSNRGIVPAKGPHLARSVQQTDRRHEHHRHGRGGRSSQSNRQRSKASAPTQRNQRPAWQDQLRQLGARGEPHRGRITQAEKDLVRDNLEQINKRLRQSGLREIDPADPTMRDRYRALTAGLGRPSRSSIATNKRSESKVQRRRRHPLKHR